jgi:hypothetical protein
MYASLRWIGKPSHAAEGKDPETGTVDPPISTESFLPARLAIYITDETMA